MLVALVDLGNLCQLGLMRLNGLPPATSKGRRETGVEVVMRQLILTSYINLYRPEVEIYYSTAEYWKINFFFY